jgi:hypothetical protein
MRWLTHEGLLRLPLRTTQTKYSSGVGSRFYRVYRIGDAKHKTIFLMSRDRNLQGTRVDSGLSAEGSSKLATSQTVQPALELSKRQCAGNHHHAACARGTK